MDSNDVVFDRSKFDAVWRRVMPEAAEFNRYDNTNTQKHAADDTAQLRAFMDDEANDAQTYSILATMCPGTIRNMLSKISADERWHLKKLRARYFILTGETYTPPDACPLIYAIPNMLRYKYAGEKGGAAAYNAAASKTSIPELADTYHALAEDELRHSKIIACIITSIM